MIRLKCLFLSFILLASFVDHHLHLIKTSIFPLTQKSDFFSFQFVFVILIVLLHSITNFNCFLTISFDTFQCIDQPG